MLVSDRLLRPPRLSEVVSNPVVHGVESLPDRGSLHAYGLGAFNPDLCHSAAAGSGIGVRGHHGIRGELHVLYSAELFFGGILSRLLQYARAAIVDLDLMSVSGPDRTPGKNRRIGRQL